MGLRGFPGGSEVKNLHADARDTGSIPGSGISPGEGHGNPLQYSCLENPVDRGAWQATVTKSWTRLIVHAHTHTHTHTHTGLERREERKVRGSEDQEGNREGREGQ